MTCCLLVVDFENDKPGSSKRFSVWLIVVEDS